MLPSSVCNKHSTLYRRKEAHSTGSLPTASSLHPSFFLPPLIFTDYCWLGGPIRDANEERRPLDIQWCETYSYADKLGQNCQKHYILYYQRERLYIDYCIFWQCQCMQHALHGLKAQIGHQPISRLTQTHTFIPNIQTTPSEGQRFYLLFPHITVVAAATGSIRQCDCSGKVVTMAVNTIHSRSAHLLLLQSED